MQTSQPQTARRKTRLTLIFAVIILVPSMLGFASKFVEFIHTFQGESDGVFAVTPMVNYLMSSLGFFCLLVWAVLNGMFRDLEGPKEMMLQRERDLDRQ
jgi:hypothetical protein